MSARVKVDEDLPRQIAGMMAAQGHDAATVAAQGWQGAHDDDLWPRVQSEQRWLITADKGFADLRRHPPRNPRRCNPAAGTGREPARVLGACRYRA